MSDLLILNDRSIPLRRFPPGRDESLRAWDAADEYILRHLAASGGTEPDEPILVLNDAFGALAVALPDRPLTWWNDSFLARRALAENLAANGLTEAGITFAPGSEAPIGTFKLVVIKVPKSLDFFRVMLTRLRSVIVRETRIVAGSMIKHTPARAYRLLEDIIGPTRTGRGWKKARLAFVEFDINRGHPCRPEITAYDLPGFDLTLTSRPGVFARHGLDPGTRLLAAHLPRTEQPWRIADLGCGNGVLALALARQCPQASILGVDESYQAVASARENRKRAGLMERDIRFEVGDGLAEAEPESLAAVVCNPPFHQAQTVGDHLAWRMFTQARQALASGGELRIVGNRSLGYHVKLKKLFGNCEVLNSDRKFVVLRAIR